MNRVTEELSFRGDQGGHEKHRQSQLGMQLEIEAVCLNLSKTEKVLNLHQRIHDSEKKRDRKLSYSYKFRGYKVTKFKSKIRKVKCNIKVKTSMQFRFRLSATT